MHLPRPFFQLPLLFDAGRLQAEVAALPAEAWAPHPDRLEGNSAVELISAGGIETESMHGQMLPTRWLAALPYVRQVLASFGVVWSRSRLMRLAPGSVVPEHADINLHWHTRVRVHIPVLTRPEVHFHCGGTMVHMGAGEAWIFDNWRRHRVENRAAHARVHLVADTTGTAAFWRLTCGPVRPRERWSTLPWRPAGDARPPTEDNQRSPVMPAAEVQLLISDLCAELAPSSEGTALRARATHFVVLMEGFVQDWRQLTLLHGIAGQGRPEFQRLASSAHGAARTLAQGLIMRTNGISALHVLEARVLKHLLVDDEAPHLTPRGSRLLENPVFIVAAPRSGSTLLFETLACSPAFNTFGGEAHWLIEDVAALRPGAPGLDSNRLISNQATPEVIAAIRQAASLRLQGPGGRAPGDGACLLEKTPKNSLRIPFLNRAFPRARFIFLWRDPRENLSSIMEAWRSGRWVTYPVLPGWDGAWSLLLPPGWQALRGASMPEIAAWQWRQANDIALDDLQRLRREQWTAVGLHQLLADPAATIRRLCAFIGTPFDQALQARTEASLPPSRSTQTPPDPDKWRSNEGDIERVLPNVERCWQRLRALA